MADPNGVGGSGGGSQDIPFDVLAQLAQQSSGTADFERRKQEWLVWHSQGGQAALKQISDAIPAGWQQKDATHFFNPAEGRIYELRKSASGGITFDQYTAADSKAFLAGLDNGSGSGSGGSGGSGTRLSSDDPRYWQLQYDQLNAQLLNSGLDAESARRQALATLIASRNNLATNTAQTSAQVAAEAAKFAANPRDTYAEALYRNQVGGSTPFGDTNNSAFGEYGKALAQKAQDIFQPVAQDLDQARKYRDAIPLPDFLNPSPAVQQITGISGGADAGLPASSAPAPDTNILTQLTDRLKAMSPEDQRSFREYVTGGNSPQPMAHGGTIRTRHSTGNITGSGFGSPGAFADGGSLNFDGMFDRAGQGYSPSSSEGGTNLNLHERAVVVGESGHIYATLGEKRPDGTQRAEQLQIKPLKSEVEKDKKLADAHKAVLESQKTTMKAFAGGGTVNSPSLDDMNAQYSALLERLGGSGGGSSTPFGGARFLAGAPANAIMADPFLKGITDATYSMKGVNPDELWAQVAKFTPTSPVNNIPRVNFA